MKKILFSLFVLSALNCLAFNEKDSAVYYLNKAMSHKAHPHLALPILQKAMSFDKGNPDILRAYVAVTMELRKYEFSKDALEQLYQLNKNDQEVIGQLAHVYFYLRKFDEAIEFGKKMIENGIGDDADYLVGKSEYENENYADAVRFLLGYLKRVSNRPDVTYTVARCYVEMSDYKKAADFFEKTVAIDSNNSYRIYEMALVFSAIPDEKTAIRYFEKAAAKGYKKDNDYYENLANSYSNLGQFDKAIENYLMVLKRKPNDAAVLFLVADAYYRLKKYDEAIEHWNRIYSNNNQDGRSLFMIGMCFQKKGEKAKGEAICDKAIQIDPSLANNKHQIQLNPGL